jgi:hypothetical protein
MSPMQINQVSKNSEFHVLERIVSITAHNNVHKK